MSEEGKVSVKEYADATRALISTLKLTDIQGVTAHLILERMETGELLAALKSKVSATKSHAEHVKYLRLDIANAEGRLAGSNADERKLAKETVLATDAEIVDGQLSLRIIQRAYDEVDAVYSNLYQLIQLLMEAVQREATE